MKKKILFLSANPKDTERLRLDEEIREINNGLRLSKNRDKFSLKYQFATRIDDLRRALLGYSPNIIHFSGHGDGEDGIALEDKMGHTFLVGKDALAEFFSLFSKTVECVILNACYSEAQALAIAESISYVIGMKKGIGDVAAIEFSKAFYDGLGNGDTVEFAFKLGCNAIRMAGISEYDIPVLIAHSSYLPTSTSYSPQEEKQKGDSSSYQSPEFVGRLPELSRLTELASKHPIICVYGQAGIGKTALVLEWRRNRSSKLGNGFYYLSVYENQTCDEIIAKLLLDLGVSKEFEAYSERKDTLIKTISQSLE